MGKGSLKRPATVPESEWDGMNGEARAFVVVLVQWIEELERRVRTNSRIFSLPPSTDYPGEGPAQAPRTSSGRNRGTQPGHGKTERTLSPTDQCDRVEHHKLAQCDDCGTPLAGDDPDPRRKQVMDLPSVRPVMTEHQVHTLICPSCGARNCGALPDHVPRGWFAPQVSATVMLLTGLGRMSHRIMHEWPKRLLGLEISVGQLRRLQRLTSRCAATGPPGTPTIPESAHLQVTC